MSVYLGVDIGGTKTRLALVSGEGRIMAEEAFSSEGVEDVELYISRLHDEIRGLLQRVGTSVGTLEGVGIGCAGQISQDGRVVRFSPNLGWRDIPLADMLEVHLGRPVVVENDVRAAALGEAVFGAGRGVGDLICLFVGTGVGSGILIGGRLLRGEGNLAGEVGHTKLDPDGPPCTCGGRGCLEVYVGGAHVRRRIQEEIAGGAETPLARVDSIHVRAVDEWARRGDPLAGRYWKEIVWALGMAASNLVTLLNPRLLILGGGVVEASPVLVQHVRDAISRWVTMLSRDRVEVVRAQLGPRAGAVGASQLPQPKARRGPSAWEDL